MKFLVCIDKGFPEMCLFIFPLKMFWSDFPLYCPLKSEWLLFKSIAVVLGLEYLLRR